MRIGLYLLTNLAILLVIARASGARRWRLAAMLFLFGFVVGLGNNLIEAVAFRVMTPLEALNAAIPAIPMFALLSLAAVALGGRWRGAEAPPVELSITLTSLVAVIGAYEFLYFAAGQLVYPYVADFYESRGLPPLALVAALQVPRALIFVGAAYPLLRSGLSNAPLVIGLAYAVLGGLAPLILDNPYMPENIRFYHAIETGASNFLFGLVVGWLFERRPTPAQA